MKCPDELTREALWALLGEYASDVADANGILFSDNRYVEMACDQHDEDVSDSLTPTKIK